MSKQKPKPAKSKPATPGDSGSLYSLSGKANKDWNMYLIRDQGASFLTFLISLPIGYALMCYLALGGNTDPNTPILGTCYIIGMGCSVMALFAVCCWYARERRHLRRAQLITVNDKGLIHRAKAVSTELGWDEIADIFPTTTDEYAIWTKKGDYFFSQEMDRARELYLLIRSKISSKVEYDVAFQEQEDYRTGVSFLIFIVSAFAIFPAQEIVKHLSSGALSSVTLVAIVAGVILVCDAVAVYFYLYKAPQCIRVGAPGVMIKDAGGSHSYDWSSIQKVRKTLFGPAFDTKDGSYLMPWRAIAGPRVASKEKLAANKALKEDFDRAMLPFQAERTKFPG